MVTKCVCLNVPFWHIIQYATLEQAITTTKAGTKCGRCKPYLQEAHQSKIESVPLKTDACERTKAKLIK